MTIHLYNMLLAEAYLLDDDGEVEDKYGSDIYLFTTLRDLFADAWFVNGEAPTSNFHQAWTARLERMKARVDDPVRLNQERHNQQTAVDI